MAEKYEQLLLFLYFFLIILRFYENTILRYYANEKSCMIRIYLNQYSVILCKINKIFSALG